MNRARMFVFIVPLVAFVIVFSGCGLLFGGRPGANFLGTAMDKATTVAGDKVGQKVGENVGTAMAGYADASLRGLSPALMQMYVSSLFSSVFYAGGYSFEYKNEYKPGDWSKWKATGMEEGSEFQKAFLKKEADGKEWWQITSFSVRDGKPEEVVLESLFSAPDGICPKLLGFKDWIPAFAGMTTCLRYKTLKNVIPAQAGIQSF